MQNIDTIGERMNSKELNLEVIGWGRTQRQADECFPEKEMIYGYNSVDEYLAA